MWLFEPPKRLDPMADTRYRLWCRYSVPCGVAVGRLADGSVQQFQVVDPEAYPQVVTWWQGGRVHEVSEADANALTVAGYGPFLSPVTDG